MKCLGCGADIFDGVKKCPYCKTLTQEVKDDEKFRNFDFKYTITSDEQMEKIRETVRATSKAKKKGAKKKLEQFFANRRAAKRARKRAVRRGEDPELAVKKLEMKEETNPFLKSTAVPETEDDSFGTYKRVDKKRTAEKDTKSIRQRPKRSSLNSVKNSSGAKVKVSKPNKQLAIRKFVGIGAILVVLVLIVSLFVMLFSWIFGDDTVGSYLYAKDNALNIIYDSESLTVSKNVIDENYMRKLSESEAPVFVDSVIKSEGLVHTSKSGDVTYFFENYDPETKCGRLRAVMDGDVEKAITVSEAVHNSIVITPDGRKVLYLRAYDPEIQTGVLHYWEEGLEEPLKITTDIDPHTYQFSKDGNWALFIENFNRSEKSGDLFAKDLEELEQEKVKIDSDVCELFGGDGEVAHHVYGKEFDPADGSFDVYAVNEKGETKRLGERTKQSPLLQKNVGTVLILGIDDDGQENTNNLYSVEVSSGKKTKVDSEVHSVIMLSENEETIIYEKLYNDEVADCYAYTEGELPSKIAGNVIANYDIVGTNPQLAITDDCENILYISDFDPMKAGGTLIWCVYEDGEVLSEKIVAEDVRSCYSTDEGLFVFTKNYSVSKNFFDVYVFENGKETLLKEEVYPEMFDVDKTGNNIYYISNFNVEGNHGILERMNLKGESVELEKGVYGFVVTKRGDVLFKKNFNSGANTFDLYYLGFEETESVEINTSVGEIL